MLGIGQGNLKAHRNEAGENLLHTCADVATAVGLLSAGVEVNGRNTGGQVPLHRQMRSGNRDVVLYLLTQSTQTIDPNAQEADGTAPLHLAQDVEVNNALLHKPNINPNIKTNAGITPLMSAIIHRKNVEIVEALLNHPRINTLEVDNAGQTALDYAAADLSTPEDMQIYNLIKAKTDTQSLTRGFTAGMYNTRQASNPLAAMAQAATSTTTRQHRRAPSAAAPQPARSGCSPQ